MHEFSILSFGTEDEKINERRIMPISKKVFIAQSNTKINKLIFNK